MFTNYRIVAGDVRYNCSPIVQMTNADPNGQASLYFNADMLRERIANLADEQPMDLERAALVELEKAQAAWEAEKAAYLAAQEVERAAHEAERAAAGIVELQPLHEYDDTLEITPLDNGRINCAMKSDNFVAEGEFDAAPLLRAVADACRKLGLDPVAILAKDDDA